MGVAAEEALDVRGVLPREEAAAAAGGGAMRKRKWCMAFLYRTLLGEASKICEVVRKSLENR
jgi:hypothetical protein